ncbi:Alkaline nuclease [Orchesella cincta]|uniref:Alkaline nuclease n=1 Tax=Orchesella cincta TaxID=48709 RepID=A0A1D2M1D9_ORCCI|nr:Alkaline nuclease [Orchesella cincta]
MTKAKKRLGKRTESQKKAFAIVQQNRKRRQTTDLNDSGISSDQESPILNPAIIPLTTSATVTSTSLSTIPNTSSLNPALISANVAQFAVSNANFTANSDPPKSSGNETDMPQPAPKRMKYNKPSEISSAFLTGRRILSLASIGSGLIDCLKHGRTCEHGESISIEKEVLVGQKCTLHFGCNCGWKTTISSDTDEETLPINKALPWACTSTPIGFDAVTSFLNTLDIPTPNAEAFKKLNEEAGTDILQATELSMKSAGEEEKRIALEKGNFVKVGGKEIPAIAVQTDGFWQKRSWGHSYNSMYGAAAIIGCVTKKVLFFAIRQKTCYLCSKHATKGTQPKPHVCFKNWDNPSTAMESSIIVEGFQKSIEVHGLVYNCFIGDGDAVHSSLLKAKIYDSYEIRKIECINHLVRNLNTKLRNIATNNLKGRAPGQITREERSRPGMENRFQRVGLAVHGAACYYNRLGINDVNIDLLTKDICNIRYHIFGRHTNCQAYFCKREGTEPDLVPQIESSVMWKLLGDALLRIANNAASLIERKNSNLVESFASVVGKFIQGKRINLGGGSLYKSRVASAVLSFNTTTFWPAEAYELVHSRKPSILWLKRQKYSVRRRSQAKKPAGKARSFKFGFLRQGDADYGSNPTRPDLSPDQLASAILRYRETLSVDLRGQLETEELTRTQSDNNLWFEERKKRMTASMAGTLFKMRSTTDNTNVLKSLLGMQRIQTPAMEYGKLNEEIARLKYEQVKGLQKGAVKESGFFVSLEDGIFGASTDGLVGDDGILEIKCPYSIRDVHPREWVKKKDSPIVFTNGDYKLKERHNYHYQVVQELHVTGRAWCDFVIYTKRGMIIIRVFRDDTTLRIWEQMKPVLERFWVEDLAPELVDSRIERGIPQFRAPSSRKKSQKVIALRKITPKTALKLAKK